MAQPSTGTSSVSREPSMEEILASIRRIIEESDTTRPEDALPLAVNSDVPSQTAVSDPVKPYGEETGLEPREGIAVQLATPSVYDSAFARPASPLQSNLVEREPVETITVPEALAPQTVPDKKLLIEEPADYLGEEPVVSTPPEDTVDAVPEPAKFVDKPVPESVSTPSAPAIEHVETSMEEDVSVELAHALEPILSENTERQVSAAFEDLSFAVHSEQRRPFDEIAQEIMRPLLQDWLDNNLPTLVERLVREEIERVARGGKR